MSTDVVVIGACAAGLMAARELRRAGRSVVVLEAAARAGGRLLTASSPATALPLELGAEFLHGEAPVTRGLLDELRLPYLEGGGSERVARAGEVRAADDRFEQVGRLFSLIDRSMPDTAFADWLAAEPGGADLANARALARRFVEGFHAADAQRISTHALAGGGGTDEVERSARLLPGHGALVHALLEELGNVVRFNASVRRVRWQPGSCSVEVRAAGGGQEYRGRACIVTASVGVLQAGGIELDPLPRELAGALAHVAMGDVVRLAFVFRTRFWEDARLMGAADEPPGFIHTPDSPFNVWWSQQPVRAPVLVTWAGGPAARALLGMGAAEREHCALADLAAALGVAPERLERERLDARLHDWSADPLVRGAYSYPLVGGAEAWRALARVHEGTLALAGEALVQEQGTVEGALASGRQAARALLDEGR